MIYLSYYQALSSECDRLQVGLINATKESLHNYLICEVAIVCEVDHSSRSIN